MMAPQFPQDRGCVVSSERLERRLTAVLAADVAGYSLLMGRDEEGTLAKLKSLRKALVNPAVAEHRGHIVKTTGDGMLVQFASAVDAARCALEIQRGMAQQNAEVPQDVRIEFRVGIHVGDIIVDENDILANRNIVWKVRLRCPPVLRFRTWRWSMSDAYDQTKDAASTPRSS